mgnify:CR=1 FL=1
MRILISYIKKRTVMKKNLRRLVGGMLLLIVTACGKNNFDPDPDPTPDPGPGVDPTPDIVVRDLSADGTSNSYIILQEGACSFDATVKGNGSATEGLEAPEKMSPDSAALLWETNIGMITDVKLKDGTISFKAAGVNGNAVIAAYSAARKIIWSWHIWFPEEKIKTVEAKSGYEVMNMNLGAMTSSFGETSSVKPYGLLYQWGRKDPFPGSPTLTGNTNTINVPVYGPDGKEVKISNSSWTSTGNNTIEYSIEHPTICLSNYAQNASCKDWLKSSDSNGTLWGNPKGDEKNSENEYPNKGAKSYYDPCPVGYRVPPVDVFRTFTATGAYTQNMVDFDVADSNGDGVINEKDYNYGWHFNMKNGSLFFPSAARYDGQWAMLMGSKSGLWGSYWGNAPAKSYSEATGFGFCVLAFMNEPAEISVSATAAASRADAYSVRCVKE